MKKLILLGFLGLSLIFGGCASNYPQKPVAPIVVDRTQTKIVQSNVPQTNTIAGQVGDSATALTQSSGVIKIEAGNIISSTTEPNTKVSATVISRETVNLDNLVNRLLDQQKQISDLSAKISKAETDAQTAEKTANDQITALQAQFKQAIDNQKIGYDKVVASRDAEITKLKSDGQKTLNALLALCIIAGIAAIVAAGVIVYLSPTSKLGISVGIGGAIAIAVSTALMTESVLIPIIGCGIVLVLIGIVIWIVVKNHKTALNETVATTAVARDALKTADPAAEQKIFGPDASKATPGTVDVIQSTPTQALVNASIAKQGL